MHFGLPDKNPYNLVSYIRRHRGLFWLEAAGGIIYNTVIVTGPIIIGYAIDRATTLWTEGVSRERVLSLLASCLLLVAITAFFQYARYVKRKYIRDMCFRIRSDMRAGLMERTLDRTMADLERESVGDLMSRLIGDVEQVVSTVENTINEAWDTWLLMIAYLIALLFYDWMITLICSLPIPLALMLAEAARHPLYRYSTKARQSASRVTSHLHSTLNHVALLRLFGREEAERDRLHGYAEEQAQWAIRTSVLQNGMMPIYATLASLGVVGVLGLGGQRVIAGTWSIGAFTAYLSMFLAMSRRTWVAARVFNRWHGAKASWERVRDKLSSLEASRSDISGEKELPEMTTGSIVIEGLTFSYPSSEHPVLQELNFEIPIGSVVGVTGAVGSGKSALASVLTGLYPYKGSISINGVELRDLSPNARCSLVAYAGQDAFLFSTSIAGNIAFGKDEDVDQENMAQALHLSALTEDLSLFPEGVDTRIGERGLRVSGGQRQRMALARTLYTNCPLLILDDPFSAVDIATERRMIQRLRTEMPGRTVFIFSHRLNAFEYADQILVLDHGRLVQKGSHEELASQDGIYQRIYSAQIWLERGHDAG